MQYLIVFEYRPGKTVDSGWKRAAKHCVANSPKEAIKQIREEASRYYLEPKNFSAYF